ncbi:MAG: High light inducible protein, partial [Acidobacteriota bacterium]|nr:High light inducible protein [Acidobacteriota bacterium]
MLLIEKEISVPPWKGNDSIFAHFEQSIQAHLTDNEIPVRFVVTQSDLTGYLCELGVLSEFHHLPVPKPRSIFDFAPRKLEKSNKFNVVMIVPTGIGAAIGGHSGDAAPAARLLAGACDTLVTHPNVVNASDINELPENGLYVEGSIISQLLMGTVGLVKVRSNRVMLVIDKHTDSRISDFAINAASAARASIGVECPLVVEMDPPIRMQSKYSKSSRAVGRIESLERLCELILRHRPEFDALAITSVIDIPKEYRGQYYKSHGEIANPWGGVEAMLTHAVTMLFGVPAAHSPMLESFEILNIKVG